MKKYLLVFSLFFCFSSNILGTPKAKLIFPVDNQRINQLDPALQWKYRERDNLSFEIKIAEDPFFQQNVREFSTHLMKLHCNIPYLKGGMVYYWTVRAKFTNARGIVVYSKWSHAKVKDVTKFRFQVNLESIGYTGFEPRIVSPTNNNVVTNLQPELEWQFPDFSKETYQIKNTDGLWVSPAYNNIYFHLQFSDHEDFTSNMKVFEITNNRRTLLLRIPVLQPETKYYWKIKAFYLDPYDNMPKESKWSDEKKNPGLASFITAQSSKGEYEFSEGLLEELFDIYKIENVERLSKGNANCFSPVVSMNGSKLAFCSDERGINEIYVIDLEEKMYGGTTQKTNTQSGRYNFSPFWLFNDEQIGFFSNRYNKDYWHLFSSNRGTGVTLLTAGFDMVEDIERFNLSGSCSTDGRIVFSVKFDENEIYMLYLLDLEENSLTQLRPGMMPDIRDDDRIVFCSDETGNFEIWMVELEGRSVFRPTILNAHHAHDFDPALSPDGSRIAFASHRSGNTDIWMMNADGTELRQITFHPMADRKPQWIDNRTIVFQSNRTLDENREPVFSLFRLQFDR